MTLRTDSALDATNQIQPAEPGPRLDEVMLIWEHDELTSARSRNLRILDRTLGGLLQHGLLTELHTVEDNGVTCWLLRGPEAGLHAQALVEVSDVLGLEANVMSDDPASR